VNEEALAHWRLSQKKKILMDPYVCVYHLQLFIFADNICEEMKDSRGNY